MKTAPKKTLLAAVAWWHSVPQHFTAKEPKWIEDARKILKLAQYS